MPKPLNGPALCKKGPWKGSLCAVASADVGDGFEVPVWVLVSPTGGVAVIRMNQGKAADEERRAYYEAKEAHETEVAKEIAGALIHDFTDFEKTQRYGGRGVPPECECKDCKAEMFLHQKVEHIKYRHKELLGEKLKAQDAAREQKQAA